jgi:hypothetical protein
MPPGQRALDGPGNAFCTTARRVNEADEARRCIFVRLYHASGIFALPNEISAYLTFPSCFLDSSLTPR